MKPITYQLASMCLSGPFFVIICCKKLNYLWIFSFSNGYKRSICIANVFLISLSKNPVPVWDILGIFEGNLIGIYIII